MKKYIIAGGLFIFLLGCKEPLENINDYYPVVETVSATIQDDGSVLVEGKIIKDGESKADVYGFCMSKEPIPDMVENQINNPETNIKNFSAVYSDFELNTRYYFRTWAANDFGYSYGNIIYLDSIKPAEVKAPCSPALNTCDNGMSGVKSVSDVSIYKNQDWEIQFLSSGTYFYLTFKEPPKTGIYKTTNSFDIEDKSARLKVDYNFSSGKALLDQNIYVNRLANGTLEITICSVVINYNGITKNFTSRFISPGA